MILLSDHLPWSVVNSKVIPLVLLFKSKLIPLVPLFNSKLFPLVPYSTAKSFPLFLYSAAKSFPLFLYSAAKSFPLFLYSAAKSFPLFLYSTAKSFTFVPLFNNKTIHLCSVMQQQNHSPLFLCDFVVDYRRRANDVAVDYRRKANDFGVDCRRRANDVAVDCRRRANDVAVDYRTKQMNDQATGSAQRCQSVTHRLSGSALYSNESLLAHSGTYFSAPRTCTTASGLMRPASDSVRLSRSVGPVTFKRLTPVRSSAQCPYTP